MKQLIEILKTVIQDGELVHIGRNGIPYQIDARSRFKPGIASELIRDYIGNQLALYQANGQYWEFVRLVDPHEVIDVKHISDYGNRDINALDKCYAKYQHRTTLNFWTQS